MKAVRSGDLYEVLDYTGLIQNTLREDIITDRDDADSIIKVGRSLIFNRPRAARTFFLAVFGGFYTIH